MFQNRLIIYCSEASAETESFVTIYYRVIFILVVFYREVTVASNTIEFCIINQVSNDERAHEIAASY